MNSTQRMLLQMARRTLSDQERHHLVRLAPQVDWPQLCAWALGGGVAGFVARHIEGLEAPGAIKKKLVLASLMNQHVNGILMGEAGALCNLAEQRGLVLIPLKGAALNMGLPYNDPGLRSMCDLDLLTSRDQVQPLTAMLVEQGYEPCGGERGMQTAMRYSHHFMFGREVRGQHVHLELHWTAMHEMFARTEVDARLIQRSELRSWGDSRIRFLHPEDLLLAVMLHLAEHRYRDQLKWLVDVAELSRALQGEIDWARLMTQARAVGAGRVCTFITRLAAVYLDAPVPRSASGPLHPLLERLNPYEALVESQPQPSMTRKILIDLFQFDTPVDGLAYLFHKGSELLDRHLGLRLPWIVARHNLLRRS